MMRWQQLLRPFRLGYENEDVGHDPDRSEYERDFDRIIFSTEFRRLHGKTQVFPFPENDVTHTRMTHSLESVSVGRSLGNITSNKLKEKHDDFKDWNLGTTVSVACLAHDLGHPPFGHTGEDAIKEYFNGQQGQKFLADLEEAERRDFENFEANAMTFHLLVYSNPVLTDLEGGLGLTYPSLAAVVKYPRTNASGVRTDGESVSEKKPGIFQMDLEHFRRIAGVLGLKKKEEGPGQSWHRHPLAFLAEAADDICYKIMDLEDGFKQGLVSFESVREMLMPIIEAETGNSNAGKLDKIHDNREKVSYLRAKAIYSLVYQAAGVFCRREEEILSGDFDSELCDHIESSEVLAEIYEFSQEEIYSQGSVLEIEAAGFKVLPELLDMFLAAMRDESKAEDRRSSRKIREILPPEYRFDYGEKTYESIMAVVRYVSGMTDSFAVDTYRKLTGIDIPNY